MATGDRPVLVLHCSCHGPSARTTPSLGNHLQDVMQINAAPGPALGIGCQRLSRELLR